MPSRNDRTCHEEGCNRLALERCQECSRHFCPFHITRMHLGWRSNKKNVCKVCYNGINKGYYMKNDPEKYPPYPEYVEEEQPGDVQDG